MMYSQVLMCSVSDQMIQFQFITIRPILTLSLPFSSSLFLSLPLSPFLYLKLGRGCYGNGGFNTNLAISFIRKFKLSIALFAPGWVHESLDSTKFNENNYKFWNLLDLPIRHLPNERPIETSFCRGVGDRFFEFGRCVEHTRWTNHLMQQLQPNCDYGKVDHTDSFCGGSCPSFDELQLHKPILKLKCKWTDDIFVLMIYKYSTTDQTFDDSKLLVLGHTADSVVVGRRMDSRLTTLF